MVNTELLPSALERPRTPTGSDPELAETSHNEASGSSPEAAVVEIAIPVYNEEEVLEPSIRRLRSYLDRSFPFTASIVIVDNASIDGTWEIASRLSEELPGVGAIHLDQKGRGRAIRAAWTASRSEVVAYMDVDLSTDLDGLLPLVAPLLSGHSQVAIGSRIASGSRVLRGAKREFISRTYNLILRSTLRCRFSDAQCGFKAMRRDAVEPLLGLIEDQAWFFDTELLIQAEWNGLRIHEVSVDWIDDPDTRVHIVSTVREDLRGVWRLARQRQAGSELRHAHRSSRDEAFEYHHQMARYASVGILSTVAYLALFLLLRQPLGIFAANLVAGAVTAAVNTLAHVSFTFRADRSDQVRRAAGVGACSFAVGIGLTTLALAATYLIGRTSSLAEGIAILAGMLAASCVRFVLLREWAYRNHTRALRSVAEEAAPSQGDGAEPQAA
jgi:glycosyltransferase involved in cell wall biosynthesis